jgi:demethylmenaquinone methyltransferase / 2-methoxy-6-polyprenyl-1,4-benzoquinol methylase
VIAPATEASDSTAITRPSEANSPEEMVDKSGSRIQQMFGEIAGRYDLLNRLLSGGVDVYWRWVTINRCPPQGNDPILDTCTGTGDLALAYWNKANRQVPVIGTDFTFPMLTIARQKQLRQQASPTDASLDFIEADSQQLPFAANQFQIVSVAFGLRNITNTQLGLTEMLRVAKPGGKIAILEFSLPGLALIRVPYVWYFKNVLPRIGQLLARNRQMAYEYLPQSVSQFPYGEELCQIMRECGYVDVTCTPLTFGIASLYIGSKPK